MRSTRPPHDTADKQFFSDPVMISSLLRDFIDEDFYGGVAATSLSPAEIEALRKVQ